jgi:hypothetical protein
VIEAALFLFALKFSRVSTVAALWAALHVSLLEGGICMNSKRVHRSKPEEKAPCCSLHLDLWPAEETGKLGPPMAPTLLMSIPGKSFEANCLSQLSLTLCRGNGQPRD